MPVSLNNNLMAVNVANKLNTHCGRLAVSTQRLSSGLRINSASDDAAGLAIRELMRCDVAALHQGIRNANDAISMIQVADGALGIIDEKLIRMKELAEQAATGTYDSTQRLMIHSEFQAMGEEIDRIARATDFNGIKLLDGSLTGAHNGSGLNSTGKMKIHFGSANDSAEDYYYVEIGDCTLAGLGLGDKSVSTTAFITDFSVDVAPASAEKASPPQGWWNSAQIDYVNKTIIIDIADRAAGYKDKSPDALGKIDGIDYFNLPIGLKNVTVTSNAATDYVYHKPHVCLFTKDGAQITGPELPQDIYRSEWQPIVAQDGSTSTFMTYNWWTSNKFADVANVCKQNGIFSQNASYSPQIIYKAGEVYNANGYYVKLLTDQNEIGSVVGSLTGDPWQTTKTPEILFISEVTEDLVFMIGGHGPPGNTFCNRYSLKIEAEFTDEFIEYIQGKQPLPDPPVPDLPDPLGPAPSQGDIISIKTQEEAQQALERIDDAIVTKDKVRANLGAMQNRLENTASNISIQAENLLASESRISDVDVTPEMTNFVRNQVLTQSAVAMLGQANSCPHMLVNILRE